jgi:hypothetical protein
MLMIMKIPYNINVNLFTPDMVVKHTHAEFSSVLNSDIIRKVYNSHLKAKNRKYYNE